jgi:hypothetical protein
MAEAGRQDKTAVRHRDERQKALRVRWVVGEMEGQEGRNGFAHVHGYYDGPKRSRSANA